MGTNVHSRKHHLYPHCHRSDIYHHENPRNGTNSMKRTVLCVETVLQAIFTLQELFSLLNIELIFLATLVHTITSLLSSILSPPFGFNTIIEYSRSKNPLKPIEIMTRMDEEK